ncbi:MULTISPECIES: DUF917 domain-containing protein [Fusobacterium]|jgi:conserved hypothetical protein|uniref:DUF917 domain-containing protein n=1 Tax=Fusobacterium TaxID=848 RepID=UPI0004509C1B|nr:DUF917 domain-containing protein [Fusobacterium sp. CM1]EUB36002.1 PF06032 family protein [Fusobacterium sp. CM1]
MRELTLQNAIDILYGCAMLGTGGGGNLKTGIKLITKDFQQGKKLFLMDISEIEDEAYIATPYGCGAPRQEDEEMSEKFRNFKKLDFPASILAFQKLEKFLGKKFVAVASTELGGENTAEALHVACQLGLPIIDGDPAGRSVPELQHSSYFVKGEPIAPMAISTNFGEVIIIENILNDLRAEEIVRSIAVASGDEVGVTDHPICGKNLKNSIIQGAISYAEKIGRIIRISKENHEIVEEKIIEEIEGKILFKGELNKVIWESKGGFNIGNIYLDGLDRYKNETYRIWFKNENIVAYRNEKLDASVPDLICMIDKNGEPITTPNFKNKMVMIILGLPSPEIWKTSKGLEIFGPKSFGFNFEYLPLFPKKKL